MTFAMRLRCVKDALANIRQVLMHIAMSLVFMFMEKF